MKKIKINMSRLFAVFLASAVLFAANFVSVSAAVGGKGSRSLISKTELDNAIYVSPEGTSDGDGSIESPFDVYTAVDNAEAGETIVLLEGTYNLGERLKIKRGKNGTEREPIRMIADPEAKTRPVLDFGGASAGIVHGGDYLYFCGFDVTKTADKQKGFQVSGDYNTLDSINTYYNGNTGIQISRYSGSDLFPDWPSYNLIINCTSYCSSAWYRSAA